MTDPKEHPILFNGPMVRAILECRKTQTRRIAKRNESGRVFRGGRNWHIDDPDAVTACPYGQPGDLLWVREAFMCIDNRDGGRHIRYKAGGPDFIFSVGNGDDDWRGDIKWTPSIHMRCEYSRITLEITDVRIERLQDMSQDDCLAEGVLRDDWRELDDVSGAMNYRPVFEELWDSINAKRGHSWNSNPWVWVVRFKSATEYPSERR